MNFNKHFDLEGQHAFLGASKYHWINYDEKQVTESFQNRLAVERGIRLHALAKMMIEEGIKPQRTKSTFNMYVNDAIGYQMTPEQPLFYSDNCFGTADAISFNRNMLRIHDLKTGISKVSMNQLLIYTALFCLEYNKKPEEFDAELRIYQADEVLVHKPTVEEVQPIINKIVAFDKVINSIKLREECR